MNTQFLNEKWYTYIYAHIEVFKFTNNLAKILNYIVCGQVKWITILNEWWKCENFNDQF